MADAEYFGGIIEIDPFVREAWQKLPIVDARYLDLFIELMARHFNAGHLWRAILKEDVPSDFIRPDEEATLRENYNFDPDDEDDEPTYRDAREDFAELCDGISTLAYRAVHDAQREKLPMTERFIKFKWIAAPEEECGAANRLDGEIFSRPNLPPLPAKDCDVRFCRCLWHGPVREEREG